MMVTEAIGKKTSKMYGHWWWCFPPTSSTPGATRQQNQRKEIDCRTSIVEGDQIPLLRDQRPKIFRAPTPEPLIPVLGCHLEFRVLQPPLRCGVYFREIDGTLTEVPPYFTFDSYLARLQESEGESQPLVTSVIYAKYRSPSTIYWWAYLPFFRSDSRGYCTLVSLMIVISREGLEEAQKPLFPLKGSLMPKRFRADSHWRRLKHIFRLPADDGLSSSIEMMNEQ